MMGENKIKLCTGTLVEVTPFTGKVERILKKISEKMIELAGSKNTDIRRTASSFSQIYKVLDDSILSINGKEKKGKSNLLLIECYECLIFLRKISYSEFLSIETRCPECGEKLKEEFDLNDISIVPPKKPEGERFEIELPISKKRLTFSLMDRQRDNKLLTIPNHDYLDAMRIRIDQMDDTAPKKEDLENLPSKDLQYIRDQFAEVDGEIDSHATFWCSNCSQKIDFDLLFNPLFFYPSIQ